MSIEKKLLGTTSGGDGPPNVEKVFSTYLYEGTGSAQTITNGIDLDGEGGMVWLKDRDLAKWHKIFDTSRGVNKALFSNETDGESTVASTLTSFNDNGFALGAGGAGNNNSVNESTKPYASWTFRKAPRFFDVVTYTGNGTAGREISHNLGCEVGMLIVKRTSSGTGQWNVYHRKLNGGVNPEDYIIYLNQTTAQAVGSFQNGTPPTGSVFTLDNGYHDNANGESYVAYLFAHDPDGEDDDGMIACGSYTGDNTYDGSHTIDLGWEPQYVMIKNSGYSSDWLIYDKMRGVFSGNTGDKFLSPNLSSAEGNNPTRDAVFFNATGFGVSTQYSPLNSYGHDYIYMAIRAPMMKEPEAGSEVFAVDQGTNSGSASIFAYTAGFPIDMAIHTRTEANQNRYQSSRLMGGKYLLTNSTAAEASNASWTFDSNTQYFNDYAANTNYAYMFKRAKGFFDVVAYTGNGNPSNGHRLGLAHSLGVPPEMIWTRRRDSTHEWMVLNKDAGGGYLNLNNDFYQSANGATVVMSDYATATTFGVGNWVTEWNNNVSGSGYIAYLFATVAGVSKVGSYTGNGGTGLDISCGFSGGARFVLIKRTDSTGDWYIWDTERGIVTGNDPHLSLNTTAAEVTTNDSIDPVSSGFTVNQVSATNINVASAAYIFLAIA